MTGSGDATAPPPQYTTTDVEKQEKQTDVVAERRTSESSATRLLNEVLARGKVEGHGIVPLPVEDRTATRYYNVFTMWFSMNTNILAWVTSYTPIALNVLGEPELTQFSASLLACLDPRTA